MSQSLDPGSSRPFARVMERSDHRRLLTLLALRTTGFITLLGVLYAWLPIEGSRRVGSVALVAVGLLIVVVALVLQVRAILSADNPYFRAVEAIAVVLALFVVVFSVVHHSVSVADADAFTEPLSRSSAIYFTVTVFTTVGFGDITARSDVARLVVTIQMILGLVFIAVVARLIVGAARIGAGRRRDESDE